MKIWQSSILFQLMDVYCLNLHRESPPRFLLFLALWPWIVLYYCHYLLPNIRLRLIIQRKKAGPGPGISCNRNNYSEGRIGPSIKKIQTEGRMVRGMSWSLGLGLQHQIYRSGDRTCQSQQSPHSRFYKSISR